MLFKFSVITTQEDGNDIRIFDVKVAGADKSLEDFALIIILAKADATEYMAGPHGRFGRDVPLELYLHSCAILFRHFLRRT